MGDLCHLSFARWVHAALFAFAPLNFLYWGWVAAAETGLNMFSVAVACWVLQMVIIARLSKTRPMNGSPALWPWKTCVGYQNPALVINEL
jgi:hypothetical protein